TVGIFFQSVTHAFESPEAEKRGPGNVSQPLSPRQQRRWLAGVQGAAMSPLVAARCGEIFDTEVRRVGRRAGRPEPFLPSRFALAWRRCFDGGNACFGRVCGSLHGFLSRNIAHERTRILRANATIACFLRRWPPPVSRRYSPRAQAL